MRDKSAPTAAPWPHLTALAQGGGQITLGRIHPIPFAALAADGRTLHAALRRRPGETLPQLLDRLEAALVQALTHDIPTNEPAG